MRTTTEIEAIFNQCQKDLEEMGIGHESIVEFEIENLKNTRFGYARWIPEKEGWHISVSKVFLDDRTDLSGLRGTIYHELLHTLPDCDNHGKKWQDLADAVQRKFPACHVGRVADNKEIGIPDSVFLTGKEKYMILCKDCGHRGFRTRWTSLLEHIEEYECGGCKGKLQVIKL